MHCPFCTAVDTKVIDSRLVGDGSQVRRRRQCLVCRALYFTFEVAELVMPRVVKVMKSVSLLMKKSYVEECSKH